MGGEALVNRMKALQTEFISHQAEEEAQILPAVAAVLTVVCGGRGQRRAVQQQNAWGCGHQSSLMAACTALYLHPQAESAALAAQFKAAKQVAPLLPQPDVAEAQVRAGCCGHGGAAALTCGWPSGDGCSPLSSAHSPRPVQAQAAMAVATAVPAAPTAAAATALNVPIPAAGVGAGPGTVTIGIPGVPAAMGGEGAGMDLGGDVAPPAGGSADVSAGKAGAPEAEAGMMAEA